MRRWLGRWKRFRHKLAAGLCVLGLLALVKVARLCLNDIPTSFAAVVTTTDVHFVSHGIGLDPDKDAGLFAPSQALNLQVVGCAQLESVDRAADAPGARVPCGARMIALHGVELDTLTLAPGTDVLLHLEGGRLHMRLGVPSNVTPVRAIVRSLGKAEGQSNHGVLGEGEWSVVPVAGIHLELVFAADKADGLPEQDDLRLLDGSRVSFVDDDGNSALEGDHNALRIADMKEPITLKDDGFAAENLRDAHLRALTAKWTQAGGFSSLQLKLVGVSDRLLVYGFGSSDAANEASSTFDHFAAGRSTRSLVAGATAIGIFLALLTGVATMFQTYFAWWEFDQKQREKEALRHRG